MGLDIQQEQFTQDDFVRYRQRVRKELEVLEQVLRRPGFGCGDPSIGAELELHLVDAAGCPCPVNREVIETAQDKRLTLELNRFNLEINARPCALAGRPFQAMRDELDNSLEVVRRAADAHGARPAVVGILPTLKRDDLGPGSRTDLPRYAALSNVLRAHRGEAFELRVDGLDPLRMRADDVTLEGANTAWQLHLRVDPAQFASLYNAAQLATGVVLAVSGNSPFFVGHRLWDETRIAVFKQSVDERTDMDGDWHRPPRVSFGHGWVRESALELFRESVALHDVLLPQCIDEDAEQVLKDGGVPRLSHLRLHHGTVWSWNRAVYDPAAGGHLRIEMRAMPAGPTIHDMLANSAFALGLTLGLAPRIDSLVAGLPFELARRNVYRGGQSGLSAELLWPTEQAPSPEVVSPAELVPRLLPLAAEGLRSAGVEESDFAPLLETIGERVAMGRTGARWQRQRLAQEEERMPREKALHAMVERYLTLAQAGAPVHTWDA